MEEHAEERLILANETLPGSGEENASSTSAVRTEGAANEQHEGAGSSEEVAADVSAAQPEKAPSPSYTDRLLPAENGDIVAEVDFNEQTNAELLGLKNQPDTAPVPRVLLRVLKGIAQTGEPLYDWETLQVLLARRIREVAFLFRARYNDLESFDDELARILAKVTELEGTPFTIQRLAEILLEPQIHYQSVKKLIFSIDRILNVGKTWEYFRRRSAVAAGEEEESESEFDDPPMDIEFDFWPEDAFTALQDDGDAESNAQSPVSSDTLDDAMECLPSGESNVDTTTTLADQHAQGHDESSDTGKGENASGENVPQDGESLSGDQDDDAAMAE